MKNVVATFAACMLAVGLSAQTPTPAPTPTPVPMPQVTPQTPTTETSVSTHTSHDAKVLTLTGCVTSDTEPARFLLTNVVTLPAGTATASSTVATPAGSATTTTTTGAVGTSGSTPTLNAELKYALIGQGSVDLAKHIGHQVEVTGTVVPAAHATVSSSTTVTESTTATTVTKDVKAKDPLKFNVTSIKMLSASCPAQ